MAMDGSRLDDNNLLLYFNAEVTSKGFGLFATNCGERRTMFAIGRKLKKNGRDMRSNYMGDMGSVTLDDYNPTNPISDAKKYVIGGPIEHKPKPMFPPHVS
ncbi:unnamed protein product [Lupinus luteus]|uniref:Uncharacterized protein n=1 Tax=Lupinus luteus TaxID=3873 RepID=A0AAV1YC61_LUPLU